MLFVDLNVTYFLPVVVVLVIKSDLYLVVIWCLLQPFRRDMFAMFQVHFYALYI